MTNWGRLWLQYAIPAVVFAWMLACTAVCEMVHNELKNAGEPASHVHTHSLHPSMAGTGLFGSPELQKMVESGVDGIAGGLSAGDVIDSLFSQMAAGAMRLNSTS